MRVAAIIRDIDDQLQGAYKSILSSFITSLSTIKDYIVIMRKILKFGISYDLPNKLPVFQN